ncbi:Bro-N domain-containing protein [Pseudomonas qingdaonensis]|uniref:BRO-N domain-containing protein n=1 Tax=Pseudomonas qingdaonensis TaxID=2056231 RepID=UPI000C287C78|nr:BRO family protein [Pseudomonas qingdaonensis]
MSKQQLTNFFFHDGSVEAKGIRVVDLNGDHWFVAADVCKALDIKNTSQAVAELKDSRKSMLNIGLPGRAPLGVNEAGLYDLILQSRKPEAREFKDWITGTVLPAIRKDGAYIMGEEKVATGEMDEDTFVLKAIEILQRKVDRLSSENKQLTTERDGLSSVVGQHRHTLARFARTLPGININSVKRDLHRLGYLYRTPASYRVYRRFAHLLEEKFNEEYGKIEIYPTEEGKRLIAVLAQEGKLTKLKSAA